MSLCWLMETPVKKTIQKNKIIGTGRAEEEKGEEESSEVLVVDTSWGSSRLFFLDRINTKISLALLTPQRKGFAVYKLISVEIWKKELMIPSLACVSAERLLSLNRLILCFVPTQSEHKISRSVLCVQVWTTNYRGRDRDSAEISPKFDSMEDESSLLRAHVGQFYWIKTEM